MVVIRPFSMPNVSFNTLATGARQFVVQDAFDRMWCFFGLYLSSFTPMTTVRSSPLAGAEMITFFAPAFRCASAFALSRKSPVHSKTTSTRSFFQGNSAGSRTDRTRIFLLPTTIASSRALTWALNVP